MPQIRDEHHIELRPGNDNVHVTELRHELATGTARHRERLVALMGDHRHAFEFDATITDGFRVSGAFRTDAHRKGAILDVAAAVCGAVHALHARPHGKVAVRRVGVRPRLHCLTQYVL